MDWLALLRLGTMVLLVLALIASNVTQARQGRLLRRLLAERESAVAAFDAGFAAGLRAKGPDVGKTLSSERPPTPPGPTLHARARPHDVGHPN